MDSAHDAVQVLRTVAESAGAGLGVGVATVSDPDLMPVWETERDLTAAMAPERRTEFLLGRRAARRAMDDAGLTPAPVLASSGRPLFAPAVVGTISHSGGVATAMVGSATRYRSLGIDIELGPIPLKAARFVLSDDERHALASYATPAAERLLLTYFSAKEAAFKAFDAILDGGAPPLRQLRLAPRRSGYACWLLNDPHVNCRVETRPVTDGVLSWVVIRHNDEP